MGMGVVLVVLVGAGVDVDVGMASEVVLGGAALENSVLDVEGACEVVGVSVLDCGVCVVDWDWD